MPSTASQQIEYLETLFKESECIFSVGGEYELNTKEMQLLRKELRAFNAVIYMGKKSLFRCAALNIWEKDSWQCTQISTMAKGKSAIIFLPNEQHLYDVCKCVNSKSIEAFPKPGKVYKQDLWCKEGISDLLPTETGGLRSYFMVPSRILKGRIAFMADFKVVTAGERTTKFHSSFAKRLNLHFVFPYNVQSIINIQREYVYPSCICTYSLLSISKSMNSAVHNIKCINTCIEDEDNNETKFKCDFEYPKDIIPDSLEHFKEIQMKSNCLFAKRANLRGNISQWNTNLSIEDNVQILLPELQSFIAQSVDEKLDGFLLEMPSDEFASTVQQFEDFTIQLVQLFENLSCSEKMANTSAWYFNIFNSLCFVTSFAPCYPNTSSRFTFNCIPQSCFILIQPTSSFERFKIISKDTITQPGDQPPKIVSKIRENFLNNGRTYVAL